jgi:putative ABC transport system permease protein
MNNITLTLAWRNLWRHPRRTWLTIGAMVFSNALLVFMISLQFGMYELMIDNTLQTFTGHLQVQAPGYKDDLKMRQVVPDAAGLADELRTALDIDSVSVRSAAFALLSSEDRSYGVQVFGVDPGYEPSVSTLPGLVRDGRFLGDHDAQEIVVGGVLARNLKVGLGDELTVLGSGRDGSFAAAVAEVVGIFETGVPDIDRNIAEMPIGFFDDVFYMEGASHAVVLVTPALSLVEGMRLQVEAMIPADGALVVHDWDALQPGLRQAIQADISSAFFMYGILVILVAFSVMNTQLMSVLERTHEFGVAMSLGLTPGRLGRLVLLETSLMGFGGLLLGAVAGAAITSWFTFNGFAYPGMEELAAKFNLPSRFYPEVTVMTLFAGPAVVFLGSILSALYPALRLHWLHPVEAMRAV